MKNKYLFFLLFIFLCQGCKSIVDRVYWGSYPGAGKDGYCEDYATAVYKDLNKKEIESYRIKFDWKWKQIRGKHAVVIFQKENEWYIVDNEIYFPQKVKPGSFKKMLESWKPGLEVITIY